MSTKPKPSKAAYSPVLKRERGKDEAEGPRTRASGDQNPFESSTACWGRSVIFWVLAAVLIAVIGSISTTFLASKYV